MAEARIHPTAVIEPGADIGPDCEIGPFCAIGPEVKLGRGVVLKSHVVLAGNTSIGDETTVFPFASIGEVPQDLKFRGEKVRLEIGARNRIREYVTMNPGTEGGGGVTRVGDDGLFMAGSHVAHDCQIGDRVILVNNASVAGHCHLEDDVIVGGLSGVHQWVRIGRGAMIGAVCMVTADVIPFGLVQGATRPSGRSESGGSQAARCFARGNPRAARDVGPARLGQFPRHRPADGRGPERSDGARGAGLHPWPLGPQLPGSASMRTKP